MITSAEDLTTDYVVIALQRQGTEVLRFNTESFLREWTVAWELGQPWRLQGTTRAFQTDEITGVFCRRALGPELADATAPEAEEFVLREASIALRGLYDSLRCPWISRPDAVRMAENKPRQLRIARSLGLRVPETIVTNDPEAARRFVEKNGLAALKPLDHGELGTGLVGHTSIIDRWNRDFDEDVKLVPHFLQRFVPKQADYRVTIVDEHVFSCRIDVSLHPQYAVDVRRGLADPSLRHDILPIGREIERRLINLVRALDLRFGAIDLVEDMDGNLWFLEINPSGQWAWIEERTGAAISDAIAEALIAPSIVLGS